MCGKDGKTYSNKCEAGCAKVEVAQQKACPQNDQAMRVWQLFSQKQAVWLKSWQQGWKDGTQKPDLSKTKKKVVSNTKTEFTFNFSNECVLVVAYDTSSGSVDKKNAECATDECVDKKFPSTLTKTFGIRFVRIVAKLHFLAPVYFAFSLHMHVHTHIHTRAHTHFSYVRVCTATVQPL